MAKKRYLTTIFNDQFRVHGFLKCKRKKADEALDNLKAHVAAKACELQIDPDKSEHMITEVFKKDVKEMTETIRHIAPQVADIIENNTGNFCLIVWAEQRTTAKPLNDTVH